MRETVDPSGGEKFFAIQVEPLKSGQKKEDAAYRITPVIQFLDPGTEPWMPWRALVWRAGILLNVTEWEYGWFTVVRSDGQRRFPFGLDETTLKGIRDYAAELWKEKQEQRRSAKTKAEFPPSS